MSCWTTSFFNMYLKHSILIQILFISLSVILRTLYHNRQSICQWQFISWLRIEQLCCKVMYRWQETTTSSCTESWNSLRLYLCQYSRVVRVPLLCCNQRKRNVEWLLLVFHDVSMLISSCTSIKADSFFIKSLTSFKTSLTFMSW